MTFFPMNSLDQACVPLETLPVELVDSIFSHLPQSELNNLCQVSKWIGRLAFSHLYFTPILKTLTSASRFLECMRKNSSILLDPLEGDPRPRGIVHNLWIEAVCPSIIPILQLCHNLANIALHAESLLWLTTLSNHTVQQRRKDTHITIIKSSHWNFYPYFNMTIPRPVTSNPLLSTITHLRITEVGGFCISIEYFPRLTHLAVSYTAPSQIRTDIMRIAEHPRLQVLLIVPVADISEEYIPPLDAWVQTVTRDRPELHVSVVSASEEGLQGEWEVGGILRTQCK